MCALLCRVQVLFVIFSVSKYLGMFAVHLLYAIGICMVCREYSLKIVLKIKHRRCKFSIISHYMLSVYTI